MCPESSSERQGASAAALPEADLQIFVRAKAAAGRTRLRFELHGKDPALGLGFKDFGTVELEKEPGDHFRRLFKDLEPPSHGTTEGQAVRRLQAKGTILFRSLLPEPLARKLWSLRHTVRSVQIISREPWIPWEMVRLEGIEDGRLTMGPFLAEAWPVSRWLFADRPAVPSLPLQRLAFTGPRSTGFRRWQELEITPRRRSPRCGRRRCC